MNKGPSLKDLASSLIAKQSSILVGDVFKGSALYAYSQPLQSQWAAVNSILRSLSVAREDQISYSHLLESINSFLDEVRDHAAKDGPTKTSTAADIQRSIQIKFLNIIQHLPEVLDRQSASLTLERENLSNELINFRNELPSLRAERERLDRERSRLEKSNVELGDELTSLRSALRSRGLANAKGAFQGNVKKAGDAARISGAFTAIVALAFFISLGVFYAQDIHAWTRAELIYKSVIRFLIASALASFMFVGVRMTRAYLNLRERNLHRVEMSNIFEVLVGSASTPNQDSLLLLMTSRLIEYGEESLTNGGSDESNSLSIDSILSTLKKPE